MNIANNIRQIEEKIPQNVKLVVVSKTKPIEMLQEAYNYGVRIFGENRVPELVEKSAILPKDIEWHMIGHLQRNKVKLIAPFVSLIHAVDSLRLLEEINKQAENNDRVINCLLQFHIANEDTKYGFSISEAQEILTSIKTNNLSNIKIVGVMGMATFTKDLSLVRTEFKNLNEIFNNLKTNYFQNNTEFSEISMGMSGDWPIAIEEGATIIRVGSAIFGKRN